MFNFSASGGAMHCCGVREIGAFGALCSDARGNTPEELFKGLVESGLCHHIWFVRCKDYNGSFDGAEYGYNEVREYVQRLPGVIHLGEHINPNTGNMIDGYFFKG